MSRDPEAAKPFFANPQRKRKNDDLLRDCLDLFVQKLLILNVKGDVDVDVGPKIFEMIKYLFELGVDSRLQSILTDEECSLIMYLWDHITNKGVNDAVREPCLKAIALMCIHEPANEQELRDDWKEEASSNGWPQDGENLNPEMLTNNIAYRYKVKVEEYIEQFRAGLTLKLGH